MKLHELFRNKENRDARYKELCAQGRRVHRSTTGVQLIHPQYVKDFVGPEKDDTGIANLVYKMYFPKLYVLEEV